jgi:hypothetical protein
MSLIDVSLLKILAGLACLFLLSSLAAAENEFQLQIGGGTIDVHIEPGKLALSDSQLKDWVTWAAKSVVTYYGRYPVKHVSIDLVPVEGRGIRGGHTFGTDDGGRIQIHVGGDATMDDLNQDWMMTHEMVHLTFPSVPEDHHWIEEGIATYVEPIARMRAGYLTKEEVWGDMVRDMPQGLPQAGDEGLDRTHTWGRTYWGGAMFCLLADVEIHKRTHNQKGLDDALRGIMNAGGNISHDWELDRALKHGDEATGVPVLQELYAKMKDTPVNVDLDAMWQSLGVARKDGSTTFTDDAPLSSVRESISRGKPVPMAAPSYR